MREEAAGEKARPAWLPALRLYLAVILAGNLLWEVLHLPLYTIGQTGSFGEKAFAVLHCTAGDVLIALAALTAALLIAGDAHWPQRSFARTAVIATVLGIAYTSYSEWRNVYVHAAWSYTEGMPLVPILGFGIGLSPLMQWLIVPVAAFHTARRTTLRGRGELR